MRTVERTLDILEAVLKQEGEIGLTELAQKTKLNVCTARRFCSTLVKRGYLYQKKRRGDYSLGLKLLQYGNYASSEVTIRNLAYPFLLKLRDQISETVTLSILVGIHTRGIVIIPPKQMLKAIPEVESTSPLYCTASGKLYLANMKKEVLENTLSNTEFHKYTENTITDKTKLKKELNEIRRSGVAFDNEEFVDGIRSAAAPITGKNGEIIAAIAFISPSVRVSKEKMIELAPVVKNCAIKISQSLKWGD
jgi:IclR family transcriptional regulator, KDG regulon repressor